MSVTTGNDLPPDRHGADLSGGDKSATSVLSSQTLLIDGVPNADITVYNIGGNNYFKLQDLDDIVGSASTTTRRPARCLITTTEQVKKNEMTAGRRSTRPARRGLLHRRCTTRRATARRPAAASSSSATARRCTNFHVISGAASAAITLSDSGRVCEVLGVYDWSGGGGLGRPEDRGLRLPVSDDRQRGDRHRRRCGVRDRLAARPAEHDLQGIISNPNRVDTGMSYIQTSAAISAG